MTPLVPSDNRTGTPQLGSYDEWLLSQLEQHGLHRSQLTRRQRLCLEKLARLGFVRCEQDYYCLPYTHCNLCGGSGIVHYHSEWYPDGHAESTCLRCQGTGYTHTCDDCGGVGEWDWPFIKDGEITVVCRKCRGVGYLPGTGK